MQSDANARTATLVCVDPQRVHEVWPKVAHLIERAVRRTGLSHSADIEYDTLHGDGLLWLACDGDSVKAAATTVLTETDTAKVCILTACGGAGRADWLPLLAQIEAYARAEGCACVRIFGRKGWARVLADYRMEHVILTKELR
jgi:hypothetical protein